MKDSQYAFNLIKQFDKDILSTLSEYDIENYNTKMNDALYWQSIIFDSIPLKTISKIVINNEEHIHVQIDRPIKDTMNQERRRSFEDGSYQNEDWYQNMPRFKKITFEKYRDRIISGQHVIPSKFAHIPGLRNAFERTDEIYKQNLDGDGNITSEEKIASSTVLHIGNPAVIKAGNDTDRLTKENLVQLSNLYNDKKIFLSSLMNQIRVIKKEYKKEYLVIKAIDEQRKEMENIYFTNIPLNFWSILQRKRNFSGLKKYLNDISIEINKIEIELCSHGEYSGNEYLVPTLTHHGIINNQIRKIINLVNKNSPITFFSRKNRELILNSEVHKLIDMVNNNDQLKQNCFMIPVIFCRSGLNRTMPQVEFSQSTILSSQIRKNNPSINQKNLQKEILQSSLKTEHSANLNGYHGGGNALGNNGIISGIIRFCSHSIHYLKQNANPFVKYYENNGRLHFVNVSKLRKIISLDHELSTFHATMPR